MTQAIFLQKLWEQIKRTIPLTVAFAVLFGCNFLGVPVLGKVGQTVVAENAVPVTFCLLTAYGFLMAGTVRVFVRSETTAARWIELSDSGLRAAASVGMITGAMALGLVLAALGLLLWYQTPQQMAALAVLALFSLVIGVAYHAAAVVLPEFKRVFMGTYANPPSPSIWNVGFLCFAATLTLLFAGMVIAHGNDPNQVLADLLGQGAKVLRLWLGDALSRITSYADHLPRVSSGRL
jgi:hypothetical protein